MHAAIVGFCGVMCRAGHPQRNELQCRRAQAALNEGWYDGAAAKYQENICPPYSARAFVILLPFLSVACASQQVSIPESGIRALESAGRGEEFPCVDKPIHLDVVIYKNLQLYVKSSENRELSAT